MSWRSRTYLLSDLQSEVINNEYPVRPDARRTGSRLGSGRKDCWSARFMVMAVCVCVCVCVRVCWGDRRDCIGCLEEPGRSRQI